ncbi:SusC/RagA family TonB-linked outer membrane protein [Nemorincola caseinilytica]|uniref:SusC/RagA family TonB-linked outer membrane protein n=2 Tax=Nemorincola caseinilytica TaxID=2054315 RepID=A0ABP8NA56_9BACT
MLATMGSHAIAQETQTHTVSGKVVDEHGKGLKGVIVSVRGGTETAVTDVNGDFMFEAPDGSNTVIVTAIGFATQYIEDEGQSLTITLFMLSKQLEGNVTTALMAAKQEKREVGYNSTTINAEDLMAGSNTSIVSSLQGKVAGANITSSTNGAGGSSRVVLRGEKSFMKNNNALIVVDGVITNNYDRTISRLNAANPAFSELNQIDFGNSANDINPEDIESVTVLPGAAATALYGAMGANGAIMYTTKKGRHSSGSGKNKMDITFKSTYTQSDLTKYPTMQHDYGQGNIYGGVADDRREYRSWGYLFDDAMRPWGQVIEGKQNVKNYSDQRDNIRSFYDHGRNINNYLSIAGGSDKSTYMLSMNAMNASGVVPNTFYNRYNVRFNGSTQFSHNLYSSVNVNYLNTYSRVEGSGNGPGSVVNNLLQTPRDIPVWELADLDSKYNTMQYYDTAGAERYGFYNGTYQNPYWTAKHYDNRNKTDRIIGDVKVGWKKNDWHIFNRIGADISTDRATYKTPQFNASGTDPFYTTYDFVSAGGYTQSNYNGMRLYNDLIVNYNHQLSRNFGMNAFVGHNLTMQRDETLAGIIDPANGGLVLPNYYNLDNNAGPVTGYNYVLNRRSVGTFGNLAFNYQRELFLELAARNDWSSTLQRRRQSYFYPSASTGWIFTERLDGTSFKNDFMNYGKVRMAAGGTGSDGISYTNNNAGYTQSPIRTTYGSVTSPFNGVNAYQVMNAFGDNNLRPERTREFEVGVDMGFLQDKINASFTYYRSLTTDAIAPVPLPASSGYAYNYINVGNVSNNGIELAMRGTPINTRWGLKWELFGTYTQNKNTVEHLNGGVENIVLGGYNGMQIVAAEGRPLGSFYAADIAYWKDPKGDWHAVVDPTTGLPIATSTPVYKGSYQPKFMASWGTDLSYKGIKLHALFFTKQGGKFYSQNKMNMDENGTSEATTVNGRNPYVWENSVYQVPNTSIYLPNTTRFSPYEYYQQQQANLPAQGILNASYVRLQELSLSYQIPQRYYERSPFGALEAGIFGNNLALWTAKENKYDDPEATSAGAMGNGQGFNYTARPTLRNYGVYVKVNF